MKTATPTQSNTKAVILAKPRKKTPSKRSRTGCRTCRARRVKCDEFPGACKNCSSTGRVCGYDTHRPPPGVSPGGSLRAELTHKPQWIMTSDEQRCLSFFQHRSLPHLVGFFDSPLWQNLIHRLSYAEPAVYHALVALGAVSQANNIKGHLPRPGEKKDLQNIWYRFALEQSGRSMALLIKRRTSQDPQLQQVVLVCCLLFIVAELRYGNFDRASVHLQSGLRILQSMNIQRQPSGLEIPSGAVDECIVESFLALQAGSRYYCAVAPLRCDSDFIYTQPYDSYLCPFENIRQARQLWRPLEQTVFEFMATGMKTFGPQMEANYDTVHRQQLQLLYYVTRYLQQFDTFCLARYGTTSFMSSNPARYKEQREAELIRLSCLTALLGVKVAVYSPVRPPAHGYVRERLALLAAAETAMDKFDKDPPTFTEHSLMAPSLYTAAWGSPDYFIYCRAIDLLQRWGSVEGFLSASLNADLLNEVLKELVLRMYQSTAPLPAGVTFTVDAAGRVIAELAYQAGGVEKVRLVVLEKNEKIATDIWALDGKDWPPVQDCQLLQPDHGDLCKAAGGE